MSSTMRNMLVIGLVIAAVALLTFINQFTSTAPPKPDEGAESGDGTAAPTGPPLLFWDAEMHFDPTSEDNIAHRAFPGFFEVGNTVHWVSFWFRNPHPVPIRLAMRGRSCTSCTSAKVAVVPDSLAREQARFTALGAVLPWSPVPLPDVFSPVAYAAAQSKFDWHTFNFDNPADFITIPAATGGRPTVGVLALGFTAKTAGPMKPVEARAEAAWPNGNSQDYPFKVAFAPRPAFDVIPALFVVGDMPEGSPARSFDVFVYSSTRGPGELPPPAVSAGNADPFLTISPPVQFTEAEAAALAQKALDETKAPLRVGTGYRVTVTVHRDIGGRLPDIGAFERTAHFAIPGSDHTAAVLFRGRVTGLVKLVADGGKDAEKIDLGSYPSEYTKVKTAKIYTDRMDLELELDMAQCSPPFVQYTLERLPPEGARRYWAVKCVIPAKQGRKPSWEGVVFLKAKGKDGFQTNVRLPVTGNGIGR